MKTLDITGTPVLGNLTRKYYKEFIFNGGTYAAGEDNIHNFWRYIEKKFNLEILWDNGFRRELLFKDESIYFAFILKEL